MATIVGRGYGVGNGFLQKLRAARLEEMQALLAEAGEYVRAQMANFGLPPRTVPDPTRLRYLGPASVYLDGAYVGEVQFPNPPDSCVEIACVEYWFGCEQTSSTGYWSFGIDCGALGFSPPALTAERLRPFFSVENFTCHSPLSLLRHLETQQGAETARVAGVASVSIDGKSYRVLAECDYCGVAEGGFDDFDAAAPADENEAPRGVTMAPGELARDPTDWLSEIEISLHFAP